MAADVRVFLKETGVGFSPGRTAGPTDNARQERFHRTLKQEKIYCNRDYLSLESARFAIARYIDYYNETRPHQALFKYTSGRSYSDSRKFCRNQIALLDKPAVAPRGQSVITFENPYKPLELETFKNPWGRACEALKEKKLLKEPFPRFHDLRHTWKSNARRSRMHPEIQESILGHATKQRSVSERYGRISDDELLAAIDSMTFDHGPTEILVARERPPKNDNQMITKTPEKKKGRVGLRP